ncbi:MAG TPA: FadR/GntR family transcriptional regulator [Streptosporangiaceae bacterium]|nr:FadR/GntR family transcriptional regulator [Streptosporangiaceae bacterium]
MSDDDQLWTPLRQGTVSDLIARRILEVIGSDRLRPGDRLPPERELAAMLGTSRPSLREALQALKARGWVDIRHGSGVFVADPATTRSLRDALLAEEVSLRELFDMREVLELPAAAWAAKNGEDRKLAAVQAAYEALMEAANAGSAADGLDWRRLQDLDAAFHLRIVEAAGNRFLARTQGVLQEILAAGMGTTLRLPGRLEKSRGEHARILAAVMSGNQVAARRAALTHINSARKAALSRLRGQGSRD